MTEAVEGDWELRYAFKGFAWTPKDFVFDGVLNKNGHVDIGFPAVGGEICLFNSQGPVRLTHAELANYIEFAAASNCSRWSPCPDADKCECSYYHNR